MTSTFVPFPRVENCVIVGDTAAEVLGGLRIYGKALIGGEVPNMELLHPMEKPLECIACFLRSPTAILLPAIRRASIEYVVLEDNGKTDFNPIASRETLERAGISIRVLDVKGTPDEVIRRAGLLFKEEKQAERIIGERASRIAAMDLTGLRRGQKALILLGIRSTIRHESYVFRVTAESEMSALLAEHFDIRNVFSSPRSLDLIAGIQDLGDLRSFLLETDPDLIAFTGDGAACLKALRSAFDESSSLSQVRAVREGRLPTLPYYCSCLSWRAHTILEPWADALQA